MPIFNFGQRQRFQVPVVETLRAARNLNLWVTLVSVAIVTLLIVDMIFFGNLLALEFGLGETYTATYAFWLIYIHVIKIAHVNLLTYANVQSAVSYGVFWIQATFLLTSVIVVADIVTLVTLIVELTSGCTSAYCYREAGDAQGAPGSATRQFYILFITVIASTVTRIATAISLQYLQYRIRVRNTAAIENIAPNRDIINTEGGYGVRSVTAIAGEIGGNGRVGKGATAAVRRNANSVVVANEMISSAIPATIATGTAPTIASVPSSLCIRQTANNSTSGAGRFGVNTGVVGNDLYGDYGADTACGDATFLNTDNFSVDDAHAIQTLDYGKLKQHTR